MAIAYRSGVSGTVASRTSFALTIPAGCAVDDILVAYGEVDNAASLVVSAGWAIWQQGRTAGGSNGFMAWHRVIGGEPGTSTTICTWTGANFSQAGMDAYTGVVASGDPADVTATLNMPASSVTMTCTGVTTVSDNCWVIFVGNNTDNTSTHSSADGTERRDMSSAGMYDTIKTPAGATGNKIITQAPAAESINVLVALQPAGAGVTPVLPPTFNAVPFMGGPISG